MSIKKILVPLDGSENSEKIGGWVAGIARPMKAELALATVVDPDRLELPEFPPVGAAAAGAGDERPAGAPESPAKFLEWLNQQANEYLEQEAGRLDASGVKTTFKVLSGDAADAIVQHAKDIQADAIAMSTHRGSAIARGVLGSVTDRVLRSAHIPVMAIHPENLAAFSGSQGQPEVVFVPLDGSDRSASIVGLALEIAAACKAEVVFFKTVQYPYYGVTAVDAAYYQTNYGISYERQESSEYLQKFVTRAQKAGLSARAIVATGAPAPRLLEEVKSLSRPLIVMSTRGASGIKRWVLGSVTDKVVRSSGLPVLVVPPKEE